MRGNWRGLLDVCGMMVKAKIVDHVGMQQQFLSLLMIKINCRRSAIVYGGREQSLFACVPRRPMNCQGCSSSARDRVEKHHEDGLWEQKCTNNFCSLTSEKDGSYY